MADKDQMSIEQILAACRSADGEGGTAPSESADSADAAETPAESAPSPKKPTPKPAAAGGKKASDMSVAEIMAAARGGGGSAPAEEPVETAPVAAAGPTKAASEMSVAEMMAAARGEKAKPSAGGKATPAAAKASAKASPKAPATAVPAGPRDTGSILAAARNAAKPGPMSKAEAAAKGQAVKKKPVAPPMPEKPAYAKAKPKPVDEERRGIMSVLFGSFMALGFGSLAAWGGLSTLGLARFMFPNILTEPPSQFKVGFPSDFSPDTVTTKYKAQYGVWVVNAEYEGQRVITALKSVCTHLGCTPNWLEGEQKFKCPCHGSGFYKDGINFEGPAPRPLERYAISVADDGQIEIDKSKKFQQEMGQWTNATSYVPV